MQKNKRKSNNYVFIIGIIILMIVITALVAIKIISATAEKANSPSSKYETIMNFDYVNNYPTNPNKVMDDYCYIISYLYSEEIKEEEITDVVAKSRELMHFKTLANTSLEAQVQEVINEREIIAGTNSFVTNATHSDIEIDKQFPNYATCLITEYTKSDNNLVGEYTLQMDNYQWKIYSWTLKGTSTTNGTNEK